MNEEESILNLREQLHLHNHKYYVLNAPTISDMEFDKMMHELQALEERHPEMYDPNSPSQRVGSDLNDEFPTVVHRHPMLSLANTYSIDEVRDFYQRVSDGLQGQPFQVCAELKYDGLSISLHYRKGKLVQAVTRGDGIQGDDVTANVRNITNIPQELKTPSGFFPTLLQPQPWPEEFEIRGEIYMPWPAFDRLNEQRIRDEETPFANPRNAASGSLKLIDSKAVAERGLECTLYHILGEELPFQTHDQALKAAQSWGLPVSDKRKTCRSIGEIEEFINHWDTERKTLLFATDGIVIKRRYDSSDKEIVALSAAADMGQLLIDGLAEGVWIDAPHLTAEEVNDMELMLLQASRLRFSRTEYIACPSCGRTLYDIQTTLAAIKARTSHLKDLKIGVMGCIVNGPGEMADADYGYVGSSPEHITLYRGREVVERNIHQSEAIDHLIEIIKRDGRWHDPE